MTATSWSVRSPNDRLVMTVTLATDTGTITYAAVHHGSEVLGESRLGVERSDTDFGTKLFLESALDVSSIDETYTLTHGKALAMRNYANERTVRFRNAAGHRMDLVMRAYDDGIAFRYLFPEDSTVPVTINDELTQFNVGGSGSAWIQATQEAERTAPAYENLHSISIPIGSASPGPAWNLPALFRTSVAWLLVTESDVDGSYFGAHLGSNPDGGVYQVALPQEAEGNGVGAVQPQSVLPWALPWRVVVIATDLAGVIESSLATHLSRSSEVEDTSWIRPGRVSWSWWSDAESPLSLNALRDFVDLAADIGWEHTLVDANWTKHSEGEMADLVAYAGSREVGVFLWYNSGGPHNVVTEQPRDLMVDLETRRAEMERISSWGVAGIKVDFFQSDKQVGIQLIEDIIADAAAYHLMVNLHGCTIPRGWTRRWPHLMTMEAVPGAEQYGFRPWYPEAAPANNTILPFTRNVIGPMDYTPVTFSDQTYARLTTAAHELALSIIFESGLQHFADSAESYRSQLAEVWDFLSTVPAIWDETRFIAGHPGRYVVLARRRGDTWYVGGINGTASERYIELTLAFLPDSGTTLMISDGPSRDDVDSTFINGRGDMPMAVRMGPYGGFARRVTA